ncbi:hypothetical protein BDF21DRAFT_472226 [Thamnidium elegans]|uniref:Uncharacterized protein n=1 Tax=Thamnidium elegans TaxID=101142 RepID=A0A8H7VX58_9FUNG|nr:hypothetical protein INT48_000825 [Thamnidium elegans]KAI8079215.1 hypothetical protein BDF21DRAFT_472226 [Thamnidium elegans]
MTLVTRPTNRARIAKASQKSTQKSTTIMKHLDSPGHPLATTPTVHVFTTFPSLSQILKVRFLTPLNPYPTGSLTHKASSTAPTPRSVQVQYLLDEKHALKLSLDEANAAITKLRHTVSATTPTSSTINLLSSQAFRYVHHQSEEIYSSTTITTTKPAFAAIVTRPSTTRKPTVRKTRATTHTIPLCLSCTLSPLNLTQTL